MVSTVSFILSKVQLIYFFGKQCYWCKNKESEIWTLAIFFLSPSLHTFIHSYPCYPIHPIYPLYPFSSLLSILIHFCPFWSISYDATQSYPHLLIFILEQQRQKLEVVVETLLTHVPCSGVCGHNVVWAHLHDFELEIPEAALLHAVEGSRRGNELDESRLRRHLAVLQGRHGGRGGRLMGEHAATSVMEDAATRVDTNPLKSCTSFIKCDSEPSSSGSNNCFNLRVKTHLCGELRFCDGNPAAWNPSPP